MAFGVTILQKWGRYLSTESIAIDVGNHRDYKRYQKRKVGNRRECSNTPIETEAATGEFGESLALVLDTHLELLSY